MDLTGTLPPKAIPSTSSRPLEKTRNPLDSMMASSMMASPQKTTAVGELRDSTPASLTVQRQLRR